MSKELNMNAERTVRVKAIIDENIWSEKALEEFGNFITEVDGIKGLSEHIVDNILLWGKETHIDGVGYIKVNGSYPFMSDEKSHAQGIELIYNDSTRYEFY